MKPYFRESESVVRARVQKAAELLDDCFEVPGIRIRFGWENLIGVLPVVGDLAGTLFSFYIFHQALLVQAPASVLIRMLINIGVDAVLGVLPLAGDLMDLAWKGNRRNATLLMRYLDHPQKTRKRSTAWVAMILSGSILLLLALICGLAWMLWNLVEALFL